MLRTWTGILVAAALAAGPLAAALHIAGRVTTENNAPLRGARITARGPAAAATTVTDASGHFTCELPEAGPWTVAVEREGYFRLESRLPDLASREFHFVLNPLREVFESIDVHAAAAAIDPDTTVPAQSLSGADLLSIPFPASNDLKNALRVMPGIVQDNKGGIHLNGAAEEQVLYTLNGFNLNDPLTGRFESRLSVESVQSVDVASGAISAEYGKGSVGLLAVSTKPGDDAFRYSATNFFPGIESHKGLTIGDWPPRINISGPIRRGRAWFSDSIAAQYVQQVVDDLPAGADRTSAWRLTHLLHTQANLTPSNILYTGVLNNIWVAPRTGLGALDPMETTTDRRSRQFFFNIKDQVYFGRGALAEFGFAANRTFAREIPQGSIPLCLTPEGKRGNSFIDGARHADRDQFIANVFLPPFAALGAHQLKTGSDIDRLAYEQTVRRTAYAQYRIDGTLTRRVTFGGPGELDRGTREAGLYLQDSWKFRPGLLFELGLRADWDAILRNTNLSPRLGLAWAPSARGRSKFTAGYALIYETANLRLFTRPLDQYALTTYYDRDGKTLVRGPAVTVYNIGGARFATPRARNWTAGFEHELRDGFSLRLGWLRRRGENGFTYASTVGTGAPVPSELLRRFGSAPFDSIYNLDNMRRDVFDSFEVTVRQTFQRQYGWLAGYTRSRALSNGVVDLNVDDPIIVSSNVGPMPWDTPHRFLGWAYLPLPWRDWAAATLVEYRTGYPFSVQSDDGRVLGELNSWRYPAFFAVNLHAERRFVFRGHRWEFRAGFNNLTNRQNPNVVNNNADSPNFLHFYGGQRRAVNFRIRWLGRAAR